MQKRRPKERKESPKMVPKSSKNRCKNGININVVWEVASGFDFCDLGSKMVPKWNRMGAEIDTKTVSGHKSGFSLPYTKINGFRRKTGARDFLFDTHSAPEAMKKRRLMSISVFYQLLIDLGSVLGAQIRLRRLIFEVHFRHRKIPGKWASPPQSGAVRPMSCGSLKPQIWGSNPTI